jgi:hypothetical protein
MPRAKKAPAAQLASAAQPYNATKKAVRSTKDEVPVSSIAEMRQLASTNREEFSKSKHTTMQYNRYINQGKAFLAKCVQHRRKSNEAAVDGVDDDLLEKAFAKPPNKLSADALELFLVQKCLKEEKRESTAATIQAAFAWHWDNMLVGLIFCTFRFHSQCLWILGYTGMVTATLESSTSLMKKQAK